MTTPNDIAALRLAAAKRAVIDAKATMADWRTHTGFVAVRGSTPAEWNDSLAKITADYASDAAALATAEAWLAEEEAGATDVPRHEAMRALCRIAEACELSEQRMMAPETIARQVAEHIAGIVRERDAALSKAQAARDYSEELFALRARIAAAPVVWRYGGYGEVTYSTHEPPPHPRPHRRGRWLADEEDANG